LATYPQLPDYDLPEKAANRGGFAAFCGRPLEKLLISNTVMR
jgi:hypothetical protein